MKIQYAYELVQNFQYFYHQLMKVEIGTMILSLPQVLALIYVNMPGK